MTLNPLESSSETTLGGGDNPPSRDECRSLIVLVTSAKLVADRTDNEVGGRRLPVLTLLSFEDTEDNEPLELAKDRS